MANKIPDPTPSKNPSNRADSDKQRSVAVSPGPDEPKPASKIARGEIEPPHWEFKRLGIVFHEDVEEARKLKLENPAAFKSSVRAQEIVAKAEQSLKWQIAVCKAFARSIPRPLRDLWTARDRTRKPKERLAAAERFASVFNKMPLNVAVALFKWLDGGPSSEVVRALGKTRFSLVIDPRTGNVTEPDRRGRKRNHATKKRIETAARRGNDGISQRKMATELFPGLSHEKAYARTRDFFLKNRYAIERRKYLLRRRLKPSQKSRR